MNRRPLAAAAALAAGALAAPAAPTALPAQPSGGTNLPSDSASGPSNLAYKGVRITPVGFFAGEAIYRQRTLESDMPSPFNALPFTHTAQGQLTEFRGSARQSRLGVLAEARLGRVAAAGYFEGDFLSAGTSSNSNESNSYTFRVRQFFAQAAFKNLAATAGQTWSLLTPGRAGAAARGEYVPATIDAQYVPGYSWARQFGARLTYRAGPRVTLAAALEEPQTTTSVRGAPDADVRVLVSQAGAGALNGTTFYSYDAAPDAVAKVAFDRPGGAHVELKALGRLFRDRIYAAATPPGGAASNAGARNFTVAGGGVGASLFVPIRRTVDVGLNALYGRGVGRYGSGQIADVTLGARGEVVPIRAAHGLATADLHATPKLDLYAYAGGEYAYRAAAVTAAGAGLGYGSPLVNNTGCDAEALPAAVNAPAAGVCNADTRFLAQGTGGFWYRFYRGRGGTLQFGLQYSHTERATWSSNATAASAVGGARVQPLATENMVFSSFRYYLP